MIIEYIQRKQLNVKVTRTKTTENLIDEVEACLEDLNGEEPQDKPQPTSVSVNIKKEAESEPEDNEPEDVTEPEGDGGRNFDTNEPAAPRRRRRSEN